MRLYSKNYGSVAIWWTKSKLLLYVFFNSVFDLSIKNSLVKAIQPLLVLNQNDEKLTKKL